MAHPRRLRRVVGVASHRWRLGADPVLPQLLQPLLLQPLQQLYRQLAHVCSGRPACVVWHRRCRQCRRQRAWPRRLARRSQQPLTVAAAAASARRQGGSAHARTMRVQRYWLRRRRRRRHVWLASWQTLNDEPRSCALPPPPPPLHPPLHRHPPLHQHLPLHPHDVAGGRRYPMWMPRFEQRRQPHIHHHHRHRHRRCRYRHRRCRRHPRRQRGRLKSHRCSTCCQ